MLSFLADENFRAPVTKGLRRQRPHLDIVTAQEVWLTGAGDPAVLQWAAQNNRVVLTHDRQTMPAFAKARVRAGKAMLGVVVVALLPKVGPLIEDILLIAECTEPGELDGEIWFVPL